MSWRCYLDLPINDGDFGNFPISPGVSNLLLHGPARHVVEIHQMGVLRLVWIYLNRMQQPLYLLLYPHIHPGRSPRGSGTMGLFTPLTKHLLKLFGGHSLLIALGKEVSQIPGRYLPRWHLQPP